MRYPLLPVLTILCLSVPGFAGEKRPLSYSELQRILSARQDASWQAAPNDLAKTMGVYTRAQPFGVLDSEASVDLQRSRTEVLRADVATGAPRQLDWRNRDGKNWLPPMRDPGQGLCNACVSFVSIAVFETALKIAAKDPDLSVDLSEQFLFGNIGRCSRGTSIYAGATSLREKGVPDESCMRYASGATGLDLPNSLACKDAAARSLRIVESKTHFGFKAVKAALLTGPVLSRMTIYEDFLYYKGGVYQHVAGAELGAHAVVIVGYNDDEQAFIARNSWGSTWGEQGYFRIKYGDSRLATMGIAMTAAAPGIATDLVQPQNGDVWDGTQAIIAAQRGNAEPSRVDFEVVNKKNPEIRATGSLDLAALSQFLDTQRLPDGEYELALRPVGIAGGSTPVYTTFFIANQPQDVEVELAALNQSGPSVSGDVMLQGKVRAGVVPLSRADLHIVKKDGSSEKIVPIVNPGSTFQIKWGTPKYTNGEYQLWIRGYIGPQQTFGSNVIELAVQN